MALLRLQSIPTITFPSPQPKFSKSSIALFNRRRLNPSHYHQLLKRSAVAEEISAAEVDQSVIDDEETLRQKETVSYDWSEEWYPLYLTKNVPDDAPLGLTVFDKQVVLFKDGAGELRCYEDRCPHR